MKQIVKNMKIKKFIKQLYIGRFGSIYSKQYANMLKVNNIPNASSPGEEKWGGTGRPWE